jgi:hypothetical protein
VRKLIPHLPLLAAVAVLLLMVLALVWPFLGRGTIRTAQALDHIGELKTICGKVESAYYAPRETGQPTFLNLGGEYPNHLLAVVIWGEHRQRFEQPEVFYRGRRICVTGVLETYAGKAEMVVESPGLIKVFDPFRAIGIELATLVLPVLLGGLLQHWLTREKKPQQEARAQPKAQNRLGRLLPWALVAVGGIIAVAATWTLWR